MKILITGGAGFIGSALVRLAARRGHQVINVDKLTYAANLANVAELEGQAGYHFAKVDICDLNALSSVFETHQPDAVMHLAAESHVDRSIDRPGDFIQTNVVGTFNVLQAVRAYRETLPKELQENFRLLHVSTDEVYGDLGAEDPAFVETSSYDPSSPYSASKAASDHLVRAWHRTYDLPVLITNCSNNYGPFQFPEKLIPVVILKALHEQEIPVYGKGENIRDWLYVDDHADALLTVLEKGKTGETYNIGGDNERSNLELVKTICEIMDKRKLHGTPCGQLIKFVPDRPGHDFRYAINAGKIKDELGWSPSVSWNEGFEQTIDWYLSHKNWWVPLMRKNIFGQRLGQIG